MRVDMHWDRLITDMSEVTYSMQLILTPHYPELFILFCVLVLANMLSFLGPSPSG